jgi:hypothetical protein
MNRYRAFVTLVGVAAAVASIAAAPARQSGSQWAPATAPEPIQAFVKAALADRFRAKDIPDLQMLDASQPIGIRTVMPQARLTLTDAVPAVDGYRFFLLSPADAQAAADKDAKPIAFVTVDQPAITGDSATISIGVDMALPAGSRLVKLCCCTGSAEFRRGPAGWTFVKWSTMVCS